MNKKSTSYKLIVNTVLFAINSVGSRLIVFFLIPLYTHALSDSELGVADLVYSTASVFLSFFSLKISSAVLRFGGKGKEDDKYVLSNAIQIIILSTGVVCLVIFTAVNQFGFNRYYIYVPLLYFVIGIKDVIAQYCKACGYTRIYALEGVLASFTHFAFAFIYLIILHKGIRGYILSILLSNTIGIIVLIICGNIKVNVFNSMNNAMLKTMLHYSGPLVPNSLSWRVIELSDRYMVAWFIGDAANGIYTVAYKIPSMIGVVVDIFIQAWLLTTIEEYDGDKNYDSFGKIFFCYEATLFIVSSGVVLFNRIIAQILYSESFIMAASYSPLLVFALLFNNLQAYFGSFYNAAKKTKELLYSSVTAALVNVILNAILIPIIGVYGAIFATLMSYIIIAIVRIYGSMKFIRFYIDYKQLLINVCVLLVQCLNETFNNNLPSHIIINGLAFVIIIILNRKALRGICKMAISMIKQRRKN